MGRFAAICLLMLILVTAIAVGESAAAPPSGFTPGPNPIFGSPGAYNPGQFSYPAGTAFNPSTTPLLSGSSTPYNVPLPPPEWPAVASAHVTVRLPADANLWVDGQPTKQTGPVRQFVTPAVLRAGLTYQYSFRAEWKQDDRLVTKDRVAAVRATGSTDVDFTAP